MVKILFLLTVCNIHLLKLNAKEVKTYTNECEWACYFNDSIRTNVVKICNSWINRDTNLNYLIINSMVENKLPKSQFYLYASTYEYLSGLYFGAYEDPDEYNPKLDNDSSKVESLRMRIISEFYKRMLNHGYLFKNYPIQYQHYFDTLLMTSIRNDYFDSLLFDELIEALSKEIESNNISINLKVEVYNLSDNHYAYDFSKAFSKKNKKYFIHLMEVLKDDNLPDSSFFEISSALFEVVKLKFFSDSMVKLTDLTFINDINYKAYKKYLVFFFESYFNSKLSFLNIPSDLSDYVYVSFFKSDYSNLNERDELICLLNGLAHKIHKQ